jgi:DNA-binding PadR family transcriptional regulator
MANNEFPALSGKEFLIMELLDSNGEMFGLEMVDRSDGELKKGTIYVTLGRMVDKDLVESLDSATNDGAGPRVMYIATDWGKRVFKAQEIALKYLNMGGW